MGFCERSRCTTSEFLWWFPAQKEFTIVFETIVGIIVSQERVLFNVVRHIQTAHNLECTCGLNKERFVPKENRTATTK